MNKNWGAVMTKIRVLHSLIKYANGVRRTIPRAKNIAVNTPAAILLEGPTISTAESLQDDQPE